MRDHAPDQRHAVRPDGLSEDYHRTPTDSGSFFRGVLSGLLMLAILLAVLAMLWLMISNAFAGSASTECLARGYAGAECTAYHQERAQ